MAKALTALETSDFGSPITIGRPRFNEDGTRLLDGIIVSTWIFVTRSTSPGESPTLLSARFSTIRKRSRGNPSETRVCNASDRCRTLTTSSPAIRQIASDRSKAASTGSEYWAVPSITTWEKRARRARITFPIASPETGSAAGSTAAPYAQTWS